tara:strand:+ start:271 stop:609 length:339 start_codon:yes stop_codon:yes gene_type:complete
MSIDKPVTENVTENQELTKEQLEARRAEITKYYEDHIPSLKTQLEYETLLKEIEKVRAERLQAQMFVANTMEGQKQGNGVPPVPPKPTAQAPAPAPETKKTLKKTTKAKANA